MTGEWTTLPSGENLHKTTFNYRTKTLGWPPVEAETTPVRLVTQRGGRANVALRSRADNLAPGKVQQLMRLYGATYEQARDYLLSLN